MVELPQGVTIEVRRGGHDALAQFSKDMNNLGISGYIRIERRPKELMPRVSQILILDGIPTLALHESDSLFVGLEALLEIERDSMALDSLISLVELTNEESNRVVHLYPDAKITSSENEDQEQQTSWWNNVSLNSSSWRREARLPELEKVVEAPEYIRNKSQAKLQSLGGENRVLNYGQTLIYDSTDNQQIFELVGILGEFGRPILIISRTNPEELFSKNSIPIHSCLFISNSGENSAIKPQSDAIQSQITEFLWANKQAVVYLSDIDYLASFDDDLSIVEMLRNVVDEVKANDHLLFTSCNLESFETGIRNRLLKDFELLEQNFLNFLLLDPEEIFQHPICTELTEEELSWIEQQVSMLSKDKTDKNIQLIGGNNEIIPEDVEEAGKNISKIISNWQDDAVAEVISTPKHAENDDSNEVEQSQPTNEIKTPPIVVSSDENSVVPEFDEHKETTKINSKEYVPVKDTIVESKPRTPIKIKRVKRRSANDFETDKKVIDGLSQAVKINRNVNDFSPILSHSKLVTAIPTNNELTRKNMEDAWTKFLSQDHNNNQSYLTQALNQKLKKNKRHSTDRPKSKSRQSGNGIILSQSSMAKADSKNKHARETASRVQNKITVDKSFNKWINEFHDEVLGDSK